MNTIPVMGSERKATSIDPAALPPGHKIFEYRIDKTLGGGGFGTAYLVQDINLEQLVAIK